MELAVGQTLREEVAMSRRNRDRRECSDVDDRTAAGFPRVPSIDIGSDPQGTVFAPEGCPTVGGYDPDDPAPRGDTDPTKGGNGRVKS